jgi:amyloid beta precursor protein binding protein 1
MQAHILVVGAGATATETLKNLVLPGIGRFTILDAELVTAADLSNNFFVTHEYLGKPRAQVRLRSG